MIVSNTIQERTSALFASTNNSLWSPYHPFASLYLTHKLISAFIHTPGIKAKKGQNYDGSYIKYFADKYIDIISPFLFRIEQEVSDSTSSSSGGSVDSNDMNRVDLLLPYLPQPLRVLATLSLSLCREHNPSVHWPICVLQYIGRPDTLPTHSPHRRLHPSSLRKHTYTTSTSTVTGASAGTVPGVGVVGGEAVGMGAMDGLREVEAASIDWFPEDERVHEVSV